MWAAVTSLPSCLGAFDPTTLGGAFLSRADALPAKLFAQPPAAARRPPAAARRLCRSSGQHADLRPRAEALESGVFQGRWDERRGDGAQGEDVISQGPV